MKICVISLEDMRDPRTWSGTVTELVNRFEAEGHEVVGFSSLGKFEYLFLGILRKIMRRFFYQFNTCRDDELGFYKKNAKKYKEYLIPYQADVYFFMGEYCLNGRISERARSYAYIDRIIRPLIEVEKPSKIGVQSYLKRYEKNDIRCLESLDMIFTQNEWSREVIIKKYHILENKVMNVGVGINVEFYNGEKDYSKNNILIVLRKGTEYYKGLDLLLDAFIIAKKKITNLTLHVVGTDYKKVTDVIYYYDQPRSVTKKLFKLCSIYVMPALIEPNGITYLEALANKSPTIGLNRFAYPEFCGYGKYGFIVQNDDAQSVADAIIEALSDYDRLNKMGSEGQLYVKNNYRWEIVENKILKAMLNN